MSEVDNMSSRKQIRAFSGLGCRNRQNDSQEDQFKYSLALVPEIDKMSSGKFDYVGLFGWDVKYVIFYVGLQGWGIKYEYLACCDSSALGSEVDKMVSRRHWAQKSTKWGPGVPISTFSGIGPRS